MHSMSSPRVGRDSLRARLGDSPALVWVRIAQELSSAVFLILLCALAGCVSIQPGLALAPAGPRDDRPMIVRTVLPGASPIVRAGDRVVAMDSTPTRTLDEFVSEISTERYSTVTLEHDDGQRIVVPIDQLWDTSTKRVLVSPLGDGETFVYKETNADGQVQLVGLFFAGPMRGTIMATMWERSVRIIEVRVVVHVTESCKDCELKNISLLDLGARSWVQPAKIIDVAWSIYPPLNQPAPPIDVPPPVPVGATAFSSTTGNFSAQTYGSSVYGSYAGQTTTTMVPQYDYTATNVALAHNMGAAIQADKIRQQNVLRQNFVSSRLGNLRWGLLNPGEKVTGHVYFAAPRNLVGPYVAFVTGNGDRWGAVRFDVPSRE